MRVINWQRPCRSFGYTEVDEFYNRPLTTPHLFRFTTACTELPEHGGALSLKTVLSGEEEYKIGGRIFVLRPGRLLVVNEGQHYSSRILRPTESLSIFFPTTDKHSLNEAALSARDQQRVEDGAYDIIDGFPQVAYRATQDSQKALLALIRTLKKDSDSDSHEASQKLMIEALRDLHAAVPFCRLRSPLKAGTRQELARRLLRAKEQIDDTFGQSADLGELADTAFLSKYYFLRLFTEMFGVSPGAYARRNRLIRAIGEIDNGANPQGAAFKAGYRDFRAFRRACVRTTGFDPIKKSQFQTTDPC
ncbi:MAG: AraC family transcriptional regulator [Pseudomonadota bacterium]